MKNSVNYNSLREKASKYGETKDCAVKAVAVVLNTSYEDAHTLLKKFGRKDCGGTNFYTTTQPALESRGFIVKKLQLPSFIKTVNNLEQSYFSSTLKNPVLIQTNGHIIGFRNGKAEDFTSGRKYKILAAYEIISTPEAIHKVDVKDINVKIKKRKSESFKYALVHKGTKQVFKRFKRKPSFKLRFAVANGDIWIVGKKVETKGKLEIIEL